MCTASNYITKDHYFGRNFDYEISYNERVTITPRNYKFDYRLIDTIESHFAIIGVAAGVDGYPLYYDACNEKGLSIAGLNFQGNAKYLEAKEGKINITPFEFIPYILGTYSNVSEVKKALENINLVNINFSEELPLSPLHSVHCSFCGRNRGRRRSALPAWRRSPQRKRNPLLRRAAFRPHRRAGSSRC